MVAARKNAQVVLASTASADEAVELAVAELLGAVDRVRAHFPTLTRENAASENGQAIVRMFEARARIGTIMANASRTPD